MKVTERLVKNWPAEFAGSSQNSKVGGSSSQGQMVAGVNIAQEEVAILFRTLSCSTCDNSEILGNEVRPNKVFREKTSAYFCCDTVSDNCVTLTATASNQ